MSGIAAFLLGVHLLTSCGGPPALTLLPRKVVIGHDAAEVLDADAVDFDRDGDADILVGTEDGLRLLLRDAGVWRDGTLGSALDRLEPVDRLHPDGADYLLERSDRLTRLVYSGIGSWHEQPGPTPDEFPAPVLEASRDLDGDGRPERVVAAGRTVAIAAGSDAAGWRDVSAQVGADGLLLPAPARRLVVADLDGDGDLDLLVAGGRLFALLNNGGRLVGVGP